MLGRLGWAEILIIVVLVVILFGSAKIPSMMKNVATGMKVFKKEMKAADKPVAGADASVKKTPAKKSVTKKAPSKKTPAKKK